MKGPLVDLGLVPHDPEGLRQVKGGIQRRVGEHRDQVRFLTGAAVHPRHGEIQRLALRVDGNERWPV
jgi:hypothetical protein